MPVRGGVLAAVLFVLAIAVTGSGVASGRQADGHACPGSTLYDPDPGHIWNRVHHALQVRVSKAGTEYGHDETDPLLWRETQHLLAGLSHVRAIELLDHFLDTRAERLIADCGVRGSSPANGAGSSRSAAAIGRSSPSRRTGSILSSAGTARQLLPKCCGSA